jgi:hypothetical protein
MNGGIGRLTRRLSLTVLAGAALIAAIPASAGAVTIGSSLASPPNANGTCGSPSCTVLGLTKAPNLSTSPINGFVVSWSTFSASGTLGTHGDVRLRILRPAAGGAFTVVRSGPLTSIPTSPSPTLITTPVSPGLPISVGDYVAIDVLDATSALAQRTASGEGFGYDYWSPPLVAGPGRAPDLSSAAREILYQATIEPPGPGPVPGPGPGPGALTLDLKAKKQELRKKLKLFATASVASDLVVEGKKVKDATKDLVANQETKVKAKLKRKARNRLEEKLDKKGKAKVKLTGTATTQSGAEATDSIKVKLKD